MIGQTNNAKMDQVDSMEYKLRMQMSPSLKHPVHQVIASFADITQLPGFDEANQVDDDGLEGSDEDMDTGIVYNGYDNYGDTNPNKRRQNQNRTGFHQAVDDASTVNSYGSTTDDEEEEVTPSPTPPPKKTKGKGKRKKRFKEEKSFWDVLIKCITPSVCEAE